MEHWAGELDGLGVNAGLTLGDLRTLGVRFQNDLTEAILEEVNGGTRSPALDLEAGLLCVSGFFARNDPRRRAILSMLWYNCGILTSRKPRQSGRLLVGGLGALGA